MTETTKALQGLLTGGGAVDRYQQQKTKIIKFKPINRRGKIIKTIAIYCLKIRQLKAEGVKIKFNPLLVGIATSPDIMEALKKADRKKLKSLKTAVINSALRGKNAPLRASILESINGRGRLYRNYTDQHSTARREVGEPEEKAVNITAVKKRAILLAEKVIENNDPQKKEKTAGIVKAYLLKAELETARHNVRADRKGYGFRKVSHRPPLFDRDPIKNGALTKTRAEQTADRLKLQRQQKAEKIALFNVKYKTEADRLKVHKEQKKQKLKHKAFDLIAKKL